MIIIKLMGGLGNQMFQYAFALALAHKYKKEIAFDLSYYKQKNLQKHVKIGLTAFGISLKCANAMQIRFCKNFFMPKFLRKLFSRNVFKEANFGVFDNKFLEIPNKFAYIEGYFQTEKYFNHTRNEILEAFRLKIPLNEQNLTLLETIKSCNSVSLHIRRGDYVALQEIHGLLSLDYYKQAISFLESKVSNPHFFIFSDDIPWAREHLRLENATFIDCNNDKNYYDLELMKHCKHNIIANSSFSWWGAWLNENENKIVIAPKQWFVDKSLRYDDIAPQDWIRI